MTTEDLHSNVVRWISAKTKRQTIKEHQSGPRPSLPYISVQLSAIRDVRDWQQENRYTELNSLNSAGNTEMLLQPVLEKEWEFSINSYGPRCEDDLRLIASLSRLPNITAPLFPDHNISEVSAINFLPEFVENKWEPRAQCYLNIRGITTDGDIDDIITDIEDTIFSPV